MSKKFRYVDLFCGGGGASEGYHRAGFESIYAIDREKYCVKTYNKNFEKVARIGNVSTIHGLEILNEIREEPFLVHASPPCEPYTAANSKRIKNPYFRMFDDPVGRLMIDSIRIISDLRPKYYVIENVLGILDGANKELLKDEFRRYNLPEPVFNIINAVEWGVPSKRTRVFISNLKLRNPRMKSISVGKVLRNIVDPRYPNEFDDHFYVPIPEKHLTKSFRMNRGQALVYFQGAKAQQGNFKLLDYRKVADVVMGKSKFIHPEGMRLLSPRENAKLMSFGDTHKFLGNVEQIYDMVGEAVPPNITYQIGRQLIEDFEKNF